MRNPEVDLREVIAYCSLFRGERLILIMTGYINIRRGGMSLKRQWQRAKSHSDNWGVTKLSLMLLSGWLLAGTSVDIATAETKTDYSAEAFIASGLNERIYHDQSYMYAFQRMFRDQISRNPAFDVISGYDGDCISFLTVKIAPEDIGRKRDGTIDPNALSAVSIFMDLKASA